MARPHYRDRGNDTAAVAIGVGILGLAIGAIAASSGRDRFDRDYQYRRDGRVYRDGYYWDRDGNRFDRDGRRYNDDSYYARRGYDDRYYDRGYRGF
jgi:hypothetical protein